MKKNYFIFAFMPYEEKKSQRNFQEMTAGRHIVLNFRFFRVKLATKFPDFLTPCNVTENSDIKL